MFGHFLKMQSRHTVGSCLLATVVIAGAVQWTMSPHVEKAVSARQATPPELPIPLPVPSPTIADVGERSTAKAVQRAFVTLENRDISGGDYAVLKHVSQSVCEMRCLLDGQCLSYTFNKWEGACFLKSALSELRFDPRGVSGVLASAKVGEDRRPTIIQKVRSRRLEGYAYKLLQANYGDCAEACLADMKCVGFNQLTNGQCALLGSTERSIHAPGMDMGMKIQPAHERRRGPPPPDVPPEMAALFDAILSRAMR